MNSLIIGIVSIASILMGISTHLFLSAVDRRNETKNRAFVLNQFFKVKAEYLKMVNHCSHTEENFPKSYQELLPVVLFVEKQGN